MRSVRRAGLAALLGTTVLAAATPGVMAMGSGDPYRDLQVGVTYTVYQPGYVGGLRLTQTGSQAGCPTGTEQNMVAVYGKVDKAQVSIIEGKPICSDPAGVGKTVAKVKVLGRTAVVQAFCDPADAAQWKACSTKDVAKRGGSLTVTLPGAGRLRSTDVVMVTSGKHPISYQSFVKVARSLAPVVQRPAVVGGMVRCTQGEFANVIEAGLPQGEVLVSVNRFECKDGWAYAMATVGDGQGHDIEVTDVFEAEGQFGVPQDRAKVCPEPSDVPKAIYDLACNSN